MNFENLHRKQKIRATLHRDVRILSSETCHFLGLEITKPAMELISELVYKKLTVYGIDLEAFAKHAKRATINSEDVKLLVRRNPSLKAHLSSLVPITTNTKEKRRKALMPVAKQGTPKPKEYVEEKSPETNTLFTKPVKTTKEIPDPKPEMDEVMAGDDTIDLTFD